jgi:hypothetical protein
VLNGFLLFFKELITLPELIIIMLDSSPQNTTTSNLFIDLVYYKLPLIKAIFVATELNIADCIGSRECDVKKLSKDVGACEDKLYRLLRVLSSFGIFDEVKNRCFMNTPNSNMLRKEVDGSVYDMVLWDAGEVTWKSLENLGQCVRTGNTAFDQVYGKSFFNYIENNPIHKKRLYNALKNINQILIPAIKKYYDFSGFKKIVDIGGGEGDLLLEIYSDNPRIKCILFDLKNIVSQLDNNNMHNIEIISGNFFSDTLPSADCYILKLILHDWNDEKCIQILKNCSQTLELGGKLLIAEPALVQGSPHELFSKMLDLDMMILTGGKERTPEEYKTLLDASGFDLSNVIETESPLYIIEATKL